VKQSSGKTVYAWAFAGEWDPSALRSVMFELEWPPASGAFKSFRKWIVRNSSTRRRAERKIVARSAPS
jgi:predicted NUDIX family NTP pyrophosphohydrolase